MTPAAGTIESIFDEILARANGDVGVNSCTNLTTAVGNRARPHSFVTKGRTMDKTGFFTDVALCIGCKACEVACKQ